jgi:hypothetical protein
MSYQLPADFQPITLQRVFDKAWDAFVVNDGQPARTPAGGCAYLNENGNKCAIGLCIPDGHPAQKAETYVGGLFRDWPELFGDLKGLSEAQEELHDGICTSTEDARGVYINPKWKTAADTQQKRQVIYRAFAARYSLTIPGERTCLS